MSRKIAALMTDESDPRTEIDNHADTCVLGSNALIINDYHRPMKVSGYDEALGIKTLKTVGGIVGYTDPDTGRHYFLQVEQALYAPSMKHNLLCPMQLRTCGVQVSEIPKFLATDPTNETHAIKVEREGDDPLIIPLQLHGVTSYFPTFKPILEEWEAAQETDLHVELTSESPEWDPHSPSFQQQEESFLEHLDDRQEYLRRRPRSVFSLSHYDEVRFDDLFLSLKNQRNVLAVRSDIDSLATKFRGQNDMPTLEIFNLGEHQRYVMALTSVAKPRVDPKLLAKRWNIGLDSARLTLEKTTQQVIRTVSDPSLSRRFRTNDRMLRYRRLPLPLFTDTLITKVKSRRGNLHMQVYAAANGWVRAYPERTKGDAHSTLSLLFQREGAPPSMTMDGSKEQTMGEFAKKLRQAGVHKLQIEPYSPWQNACEGAIGRLKSATAHDMVSTGTPIRLWDDCMERQAYIQSLTVNTVYENHGEVPDTVMMGETADISAFSQLGWYEWVMFRDTSVSFPDTKLILGRYLGPAIDVGPAMTAKIMKANGQVEYRSTYRALTDAEWKDPDHKKQRELFDEAIKKRYGDAATDDDFESIEDSDGSWTAPEYELYADDDGEDHKHATDADMDVAPDGDDNYLNAYVALPRDGKKVTARVTRRKRHHDGTPVGVANDNPILDTRQYVVEFPDGSESEFAANVIAENMWAQCDLEGQQHLLMEEIVDYRVDNTAVMDGEQYVRVGGNQHHVKTTRGWKLLVRWKDGSESWERLSDLKESNPIEVAEFAVGRDIDQEPAFHWWVPFTLKRRDRIIKAVNKRYAKRDHKFGIRIPKSYQEAVELDRDNGNTLWQDAISKEMAAVRVAFAVLDDDTKIPPGYQEIACHLVFDVKMEDFRRKARYVAGGHKTEAPATMTYASVVGRETVRIALTIAALNGLDVKTGDVENAYLTAPNKEKIWTTLGPEFGPDAGKRALVVRALYGLKSAGSSFRDAISDCMRTLGYSPCQADADLWMRAETKSDGTEYYSYILLYVDDVLAIHEEATGLLKRVDYYFKMKKGSIGDPNIYLGARLRPVTLENGVVAWAMSPSKYVQEAVANVEAHLKKSDKYLPKRAPGPWPNGYDAELDDTPLLNSELANFYQTQIGVLRWCIELGRVDIITEASILSSYTAAPREGHLGAVYHIFGYLKKKHNSRLIFDPSYPEIDTTNFNDPDWKTFYGDVEEAIPPNAPEPRGQSIVIRVFCDSSHADDRKTRRSRSGYFIFINQSLVAWFSKKQATIETSVFGAEFVAMKLACEHNRSLRYKLRMMGVPIDGHSFVYGDNMSVIHNTSKPESMLKKKSNSICYHFVRECAAMGEIRTGHIPTDQNCADLATKLIPSGMKREYLVSLLMYDIFDTVHLSYNGGDTPGESPV